MKPGDGRQELTVPLEAFTRASLGREEPSREPETAKARTELLAPGFQEVGSPVTASMAARRLRFTDVPSFLVMGVNEPPRYTVPRIWTMVATRPLADAVWSGRVGRPTAAEAATSVSIAAVRPARITQARSTLGSFPQDGGVWPVCAFRNYSLTLMPGLLLRVLNPHRAGRRMTCAHAVSLLGP
jgi:hypothetical protein